MTTKRARAIVVITEGVNPQLLERWTSEGLLPGFGRLFQQGASAPLESGPVPYEVPGLASISTGRRPGEHGWFSFWRAHNYAYVPELVGPEQLLCPHLWQRPECAHLRFGLVNIHGTHPPQPLNGWSVSYPMQQTVRASYPKQLMHELSEAGIRVAHDVSIWYAGQLRADFLGRVIEADHQRARVALDFWRRGADVLMVLLTAAERVSHFYWQELEHGSPFSTRESAIFQAYAACDTILGELLALVDDSTTLIALSEQGFGPMRAYVSVNRALAKAGLLEQGAQDHEVDFARTRAFEAVQGTHGVNVNLVGRCRDGTVEREDYERVRDETACALREVVNPHTGLPLFKRVAKREEIYTGAGTQHAPDIILEPLDERYQPLGDPFWARKVNRTWQSGWHRRDSYFALAGAGVSAGRRRGSAAPVDVAPTLYRALGLSVPDEFLGEAWS